MRYLPLIIVLAGCGNFAPQPNQDDVLRIVWNNLYQMQQEPPAIAWKFQDELDCNQYAGHGQYLGFYRPDFYGALTKSSECVGGVSFTDWQITYVAWTGGPTKFHETALAHELWHFVLWDRGIPDHNHSDPGFGRAYGHPDGIVDEAWSELNGAGY